MPRGGRGFFHVCALWQYTCLTLLPTVRWRYRRHVAQLCCWRLATLTGRGGGGDDNVPFDCKMTLPKTRCPTLLLTSCYLDREGGWGGMITFLSTVRWRYRRHVAQLCCWRLATLTGKGGGGGMITFLSTVRWRYRRHVAQLCCWRLATLTGRGGGGGW